MAVNILMVGNMAVDILTVGNLAVDILTQTRSKVFFKLRKEKFLAKTWTVKKTKKSVENDPFNSGGLHSPQVAVQFKLIC
jgi:hypothetical protein